MRVLVVEDEFVLATTVEDAIIAAGGMVLGPVIGVADALNLLHVAMQDGGVHAVALDLKLGRDNGFSIADACQTYGIPFLFTTGCSREDLAGQYRTAPLLEKPFWPDELVSALGDLVMPVRQVPSGGGG